MLSAVWKNTIMRLWSSEKLFFDKKALKYLAMSKNITTFALAIKKQCFG